MDDGVAAHMEDIPLPSICNKALRSVVDFWYHFHEDPLPPIEKVTNAIKSHSGLL